MEDCSARAATSIPQVQGAILSWANGMGNLWEWAGEASIPQLLFCMHKNLSEKRHAKHRQEAMVPLQALLGLLGDRVGRQPPLRSTEPNRSSRVLACPRWPIRPTFARLDKLLCAAVQQVKLPFVVLYLCHMFSRGLHIQELQDSICQASNMMLDQVFGFGNDKLEMVVGQQSLQKLISACVESLQQRSVPRHRSSELSRSRPVSVCLQVSGVQGRRKPPRAQAFVSAHLGRSGVCAASPCGDGARARLAHPIGSPRAASGPETRDGRGAGQPLAPHATAPPFFVCSFLEPAVRVSPCHSYSFLRPGAQEVAIFAQAARAQSRTSRQKSVAGILSMLQDQDPDLLRAADGALSCMSALVALSRSPFSHPGLL